MKKTEEDKPAAGAGADRFTILAKPGFYEDPRLCQIISNSPDGTVSRETLVSVGLDVERLVRKRKLKPPAGAPELEPMDLEEWLKMVFGRCETDDERFDLAEKLGHGVEWHPDAGRLPAAQFGGSDLPRRIAQLVPGMCDIGPEILPRFVDVYTLLADCSFHLYAAKFEGKRFPIAGAEAVALKLIQRAAESHAGAGIPFSNGRNLRDSLMIAATTIAPATRAVYIELSKHAQSGDEKTAGRAAGMIFDIFHAGTK